MFTDVLTDHAIGFIKENKDRPFHLNLAYNAPHRPLQAPQEDIALFEHCESLHTSGLKLLYAMVHRMDTGIGKVLQSLKDNDLWERTIVLFASDNGPDFVGKDDMAINDRPYHTFNGYKGDVLEGGVRVPAILSWPGMLKGGINAEPSIFMDWLPTLCGLAGCQIPDGLDGHDIWPSLTGKEPIHADYYWHWTRYELVKHSNMAVYHEGYKLYYPVYKDNLKYHKPDSSFVKLKGQYKIFTDKINQEHPDESFTPKLFYLPSDPKEQVNLYEKEPEIAKKLQKMLDSWFYGALSDYEKAAKVTLINP